MRTARQNAWPPRGHFYFALTHSKPPHWAPRVGLAWTFLPNTVFRAGYGLFYAPGSGGIGSSPGDLGSASSVATGVYFGQTPAAPNTPDLGASLANPFVTGLLPYLSGPSTPHS